MRARTSGFTLIEVIVVMAILGVLASIAFPSFKYLTSTNKLKSASTEIYLGLIRARNEAVKLNRQVAMVQNADGWAAGWQIVADSDKNGAFGGGGDLVVIATGAQARVTITEGSTLTQVVFLSSGRVSGTAPAFQVTSEESTDLKRCISSDLTGKPYTKQGDC